MRRIKTVAVALALAGGLGTTGLMTSASAEPAADTAGCSNWQYRVRYDTTPVLDDRFRVDFYAHASYRFNITSAREVDHKYRGNVYGTTGAHRGLGWIEKDYLDYLRCW